MTAARIMACRRCRSACVGVLAAACVAFACKVPNEDHCLHRADDANAWCAEHHEDLPYCSPCEAAGDGCVASEPTADLCPDYSQGGTGSEGETDSDAGTDTDSSSDSARGS